MTSERGFVGMDLAWGLRARTGIAVVGDAGALLHSGTVRTDDEIHDWVAELAGQVVVAAVDAPLVVPNRTGQRRCEREISSVFWRYKIGAHSSNRSNPHFDPPRAAKLAERFGWSTDPARHGSEDQPVCIEVYPHPAIVGLFGLRERIADKKGPTRVEGFRQLMSHLASIEELRLDEHAQWAELCRIAASPQPGDLNRIEDEVDAVLCAHLAWLWHHRPSTLQIYGSLDEGYIIAPPSPPTAAAQSALTFVVDVHGRPTGYAGGTNEQLWKAAVRSAVAGRTASAASRIRLEVEYRLDASQTGHRAPDLDNLLKSTIDALDEVLGLRSGNFSGGHVDDERIDRIVASKRFAQPGEAPGARLVITELSVPESA